MTPRTVVGVLFLGFASLATGKDAPEKAPPHIADSKELSVEMAKALVAGDRERFTLLAATREEMVRMLETALHPVSAEERQEQKDKVEEILADRSEDFDRFQAMKKEAGVRKGATVRFELIYIDPIREKDGMKKVRHSRVRMFQAAEDGKEDSFLIGLDDMFLFPRGLHLRLPRNQKRDAEEIMASRALPAPDRLSAGVVSRIGNSDNLISSVGSHKKPRRVNQ